MKIGDLIQDRDYPEDIAIIIQNDKPCDNFYLFWLAGDTVGDTTCERAIDVEEDFDLLSSAKKEIAKNLVGKET